MKKKKTAAWLERIRQPGIRPFVNIRYDPEAEIGSPAATDKKRSTTKKKTARFWPHRASPRPDWRRRGEFHRRIDLVTGLKFSDRAAAQLEDLLDACRGYADPAAAGRAAPAFMAGDWSEREPFECLCATAAVVEDVWRESGGEGHGARWGADNKEGPLVRLLSEMFKFAGVKEPPSGRTLRRAIQAARGDEDSPTT